MMTIPEEEDEKITPPINPLKDYTLSSVCKMSDGWHVSLINKKKRGDRIHLRPRFSTHKYKIISVENEDRLEARVQIQAEGHRVYVQFERKFLTIAKHKTKPKTDPNKGKKDRSYGSGGVNPNKGKKIRKIPVPPGS